MRRPKPSPARRLRQEVPSTASRSGVSRPAMWRVTEIHKIIRAGRFPNCSTLAAEIEVTPKTIQRDISFMRDQLGMPLEYHALKHGYFYTQEVHEFPMLQLSRNDLVALFLARHALEPLRGTRLERMLTESFSKIAEACPGEVSIAWHELDEAFSVKAFSVKAAGVLAADVALFGDLLDAVRACREVNFDYHKLTGSKPEQRTVHPYHVGQIEHGWYLLAYDPARKGGADLCPPAHLKPEGEPDEVHPRGRLQRPRSPRWWFRRVELCRRPEAQIRGPHSL